MTNSLARNGNGGASRQGAATAWAPYRELLGFDPFQQLRTNWGFEYDVTRTENGYEVEVPVPGFKPEQIDISFKDGVLSVNAKSERRSFSRSFTVPEDVDEERIEAKVSDGMLVMNLQRMPEAQPRRIPIT
jgi:HSP20 family protein